MNMMKDEILNCRCGGISHLLNKNNIMWYVRCEKCKIKTKVYLDKHEAIEAWNKVMK